MILTMDSGFSALTTTAVTLHEWYLELRAAGFTKDEALTLLVKIAKDD